MTTWGIKTNGNVELYAKSLGINANLWWGLVLLVFGLIMFLLGQRSQKPLAKEPPPPAEEGEIGEDIEAGNRD